MTAVQMASMPPNCEPMPSTNIIKKKTIAHKCRSGINSTASGYAMNARPGPCCTVSATGTSKLCAMKPMIENTAKPAKIAVNTFVNDTTMASVCELFLNCKQTNKQIWNSLLINYNRLWQYSEPMMEFLSGWHFVLHCGI